MASANPHRTLRVQDRLMTGRDVRGVQQHVGVEADGQYGIKTRKAVRKRLHKLGADMKAFDRKGLSVRQQRILRGYEKPPKVWQKRARKRAEQASHPAPRKQAVQDALHYAKLGIREQPAGSNAGPFISQWQRETARGATYLDRQPWCGIFCENVCRDVGVDTVPQWAGVALIEDFARQHSGGFSAWTSGFTTACKPGDLVVLFGRGVHVELIVEVHTWGYVTVGGNTSFEGASGSQSNGGCVAKRNRSAGDVHGVAHVKYPAK
jgi:hypothetical protein